MSTPMENFSRAAQAMEEKNYDAALAEFVLMYESTDFNTPMRATMRRSYGFFGWANLGAVYPPALERLKSEAAKKRELPKSKGANPQLEKDLKAMERAIAFVESYE